MIDPRKLRRNTLHPLLSYYSEVRHHTGDNSLMASKFTLAVLLVMSVATAYAEAPPDIGGKWLSGDGDGWIVISMTAEGLSGVVAGSPNPDEDRPDKDEKNPEPALRDRPLMGLELFSGFEYKGKGKWKGGTIYDPNSGNTYQCIITRVDANTLKVRGFIGVSLLGRTEHWTRVLD